MDHVVLMVIATQVGMRCAAVERPAKVPVLYTVTHIVVVAANHAARVGDSGYVRLRLDATV